MKLSEYLHILAAIVILTAIAGLQFAISAEWTEIAKVFLFSSIIILVSVSSKKIIANLLDLDVEHRIWMFERFGWKADWKFKKEIPAGIILPLIISIFTLGLVKFSAIMTYETKATKYRAAKRFGFYSFSEITEGHNAMVGAVGIAAILALAFIAYFPGFEYLSKMAIFYAISNMIPVSSLDGTQIFFGSRVLYVTLLVISLIFFAYALVVLV